MISYTTVGTRDLERASKFYDELFAVIGAKRMMDMPRGAMWGTGDLSQPGFAVMLPFDGEPATVGNGVMVAINAGSPENVAKLHAKALELGGTDEGEPGPRAEGMAYCGYFRDMDGNKLNAFCFAQT